MESWSTWRAPLSTESRTILTPVMVEQCLSALGLDPGGLEIDDPLGVHFTATWQTKSSRSAGPRALTISVLPNDLDPFLVGIPWPDLSVADVAEGYLSPLAVEVSVEFGEGRLDDVHLQLKLLDRLAPGTKFVMDCNTVVLRPGSWLADVAGSDTPPEWTALVPVHKIHDTRNDTYWLHTHGMLRIGAPDLDLIRIPPRDVEPMLTLLEAAVTLLANQGVPRPGEPFELAAGVTLQWLPREEVVAEYGDHLVGDHDNDETHYRNRGVLFAASLSRAMEVLQSPTIYADRVRNAPEFGSTPPIEYPDPTDTERIRSNAVRMWNRFIKLFDAYHGQPGIGFLAKARFNFSDGETRHCWLQVADLGADWFDAIRQGPSALPGAPIGECREYALDRLTDWAIAYQQEIFESLRVDELEHRLECDGVPRDD